MDAKLSSGRGLISRMVLILFLYDEKFSSIGSVPSLKSLSSCCKQATPQLNPTIEIQLTLCLVCGADTYKILC